MPAENKKRTVPRHRSFLCVSAESREIDQLDGGGNISFSRRLWLRIIGGKVFFVVVRKHGNHRCTAAELFLQQRGAEKVCPGGNADAQAELPGKMLCHPDIRRYTTVWMDTLRDGASSLVNTNKLVRFYDGTTGLKTGSTNAAGYCISATAERDGMELIAVILKGKTSPERFADAQTLLNYGFASYALKTVIPDEPLPPVPVTLGTQATVQPVLGEENQLLLEKAKTGELSQSVTLESSVQAPVAVGDRLGTLTVTFGEEVPRITFRQMLPRVLRIACLVE